MTPVMDEPMEDLIDSISECEDLPELRLWMEEEVNGKQRSQVMELLRVRELELQFDPPEVAQDREDTVPDAPIQVPSPESPGDVVSPEILGGMETHSCFRVVRYLDPEKVRSLPREIHPDEYLYAAKKHSYKLNPKAPRVAVTEQPGDPNWFTVPQDALELI